MSILEPQLCQARRAIGGPPCVGPVDAVRLETTRGNVVGCVLHIAILKTRHRFARLYPQSTAGAAIAAYQLAREAQTAPDIDALACRAAELLRTFAPTQVTRYRSGATR